MTDMPLPDVERSNGDPAGRGAAAAGAPVPFMLGIEGGLGGALSEPGPRLNTNDSPYWQDDALC